MKSVLGYVTCRVGMTTRIPNPRTLKIEGGTCCKHQTMAPDTSLQPFVNASAASMSLPVIPTSPMTVRDTTLDEEIADPDAKLRISDATVPRLNTRANLDRNSAGVSQIPTMRKLVC